MLVNQGDRIQLAEQKAKVGKLRNNKGITIFPFEFATGIKNNSNLGYLAD
jgi:hypothetical protein